MRGGPVSKEVADRFVEALRRLEEDRDVEALVEIHTDDCDVGNVAVPRTFSGHGGLHAAERGLNQKSQPREPKARSVADKRGR
jgi:hypothetical protein